MKWLLQVWLILALRITFVKEPDHGGKGVTVIHNEPPIEKLVPVTLTSPKSVIASQWRQEDSTAAPVKAVERGRDKKISVGTGKHKECPMKEGNRDKEDSFWVCKRWWWYKKSANVQRKWRKLDGSLMVDQKMVHDWSGGGGKKKSKTLPLRLHFLHENMLLKMEKVKEDGWCLYHSLAAAEHENMDAKELRKFLANATRKRSKTRMLMLALFEKKNTQDHLQSDATTVEKALEEYNRKVGKYWKHSGDVWGGIEDLLVYSLLTGVPVKVLKNSEEGFEVLIDSKVLLQELAKIRSAHELSLPVWQDNKVSFLFFHAAEDPLEVIGRRVQGNHYCALLPVNQQELTSLKHHIYKGGTSPVMTVESTKKRKMNEIHDKAVRNKKVKKEKKTNYEQGRLNTKGEEKKASIAIENMNITATDLQKQLEEYAAWLVKHPKEKSPFFADSNQSILKSVLLFYLNSGCLRFSRWKDHSKKHEGQHVDLDGLVREIIEETPSNADMLEMVKALLTEHSYTDTALLSCASCGMREHEGSLTKFTRMHLEDSSPLSILKYSEEESDLLETQLDDPFYRVQIPMDAEWKVMKEVNVLMAKSFHEEETSSGEVVYWHLHPELVETGEGGSTSSALLCSRCCEAVQKKKVPKNSIKSGVDFGWFKRLGLTEPNLPEQLILARNRLYYTVVKISSNRSGAAQDYDRRAMARINAIMFPHNAAEVGNRITENHLLAPGGLLDERQVEDFLQLYFLTDKDEFDALMKKVFGTTLLFARSHVLAQWFLVLKTINPEYRDLDTHAVKQGLFDPRVRRINEVLRNKAKIETDPKLVKHDQQIGSDIAHNQHMDGEGDTSRIETTNEEGLSMRFTFVSDREMAQLTRQEDDFRMEPLAKVADLKDLNEEEDEEDAEMFNCTLQDLEDMINGPNESTSVREHDALKDFVPHDKNLVRTFPHVFMLGKAYGTSVPDLALELREHLLTQFTRVPALDRRLLGYLFNVLQRTKVLRGVSGFVDSHTQAVKTMTALLNNKTEREKLQLAMDYPHLKSSKALLDKYMSLLRFISKNIAYSSMEGSKLKLMASGLNTRYSAVTCFFTLSPNNLANPRSVRVACQTFDNQSFPAKFDGECLFGKSGVEFLEYLEQHEKMTSSEGTIRVPEAFTKSNIAFMAKNDPVAFVNENKRLLYQILHLLIGLKPVGNGYRNKTSGKSVHRSTYYKESQKKGFLGHALTLLGVTEDHQRGHLHWHFTINAGLSGHALSRFANIPKVCDEISAALDRMCMAKLDPEQHTAANLRNAMNREKGNWNLDQEVVDAVQSRDPMFIVKDKLAWTKTIKESDVFHFLKENVQEHGSTKQYHRCQQVCYNKGWGYWGCRFSHPRGLSNATHPSVLSECTRTENDHSIPEVWWPNPSDGVSVSTASTTKENEIDSGLEEDDWSSCSESMSFCSDSEVGSEAASEATEDIEMSFDDINDAFPDDASELALEYDVFDLRNHPLCGVEKQHHSLVDLLDNSLQHHTVCWSVARPEMLLPSFLEPGINRRAFIGGLKQHLQAVPPFNGSHSRFWQWMKHEASDEQLETIRHSLIEGFETGNGNVAAFNPIVAYCTASHHNVEMLGSLDQAKNAMYYLIPYQAKEKFPIKEAFPIIQSSMEDVKDRPSATVKGDDGTVDRKLKQGLARMLGKMHCRMELSDYQVVAALLELPSLITTDAFTCGNPSALATLRAVLETQTDWKKFASDYCNAIKSEKASTECEGQARFVNCSDASGPADDTESESYDMDDDFMASEDEDDVPYEGLKAAFKKVQQLEDGSECDDASAVFATDSDETESIRTAMPPKKKRKTKQKQSWSMEDAIANRGKMRKVKMPLLKESEDSHAPTIFVPETLLYLCRGDALSWLNYYEYLGCVKFQNQPDECKDITNFKDPQKYPMHEAFEGSKNCHHAINLKLCTPLLTGPRPSHPGKKPTQRAAAARRWQLKADAYARYYLVLFRPETIDDIDLGYTWEDLESYIANLQEDDSFISKSRLMIMENHMKGLRVSKVCEAMMKDYRARARHEWTAAEKAKFRMEDEIRTGATVKCMWDHLQSCDGSALSQEEMAELKLQVEHDTETKATLNSLLGTPIRSAHKKTPSDLDRTALCETPFDEVCEKAAKLRSFKVNDIPTEDDKHASCSPEAWIRNKISSLECRDKDAASQQVELFTTYAEHFKSSGLEVPQMTLVHGPPGVGKTQLRDALIGMNAIYGKKDLKTAAFAINCIGMNGHTTASLIFKQGGSADIALNPTFNASVIEDLKRSGLSVSSVVFIEEVSTQAPWHIASLSRLCKEITRVFEADFGGCHVIFFGDFTQLGPVRAGHSIPQALFDRFASKTIKKMLGKKGSKTKSSKSSKKQSQISANEDGVDLFTRVKWFELNKQQRALSDPVHSKFIEDNYYGDPLHLKKIKDHIGLIEKQDMDDLKWAKAPVLVPTNRLRYSITHSRAIHLAKLQNTVTIRWLTDFQKWQNKPGPDHWHSALQDPCFYEYFVPGCNGFITKNISKSLHVVNGMKIKYHSLKMPFEYEDWLKDKIADAKLGDTIDLPIAPAAINVQIAFDDTMSPTVKNALKEIAICQGDEANSVIIPITPLREPWPKDQADGKPKRMIPIPGGVNYGPSRVQLRQVFPVQPALAITVHKSQGDTLDRAIIAMSHSAIPKWNFTYEQVHVAFSRVREGSNLKLLLNGHTAAAKWDSMTYVNQLKPDPTVQWFFMGFRERIRPGRGDPNENWMHNVWSPLQANLDFLMHLRGMDPYSKSSDHL